MTRRDPTYAPSPFKRVAIVQSNYIPWKGYFDLMDRVDEFVLLDDVQYTRRDWRNRNRIKTPQGPAWLTIPVQVKGRYHQLIRDVVISDPDWARRHWQTLQHHYARSPYFEAYRHLLELLFLECEHSFLTEINQRFIRALAETLGIATRISVSMDYALEDGKSERLLGICRQLGATEYWSGPAARCYLDERLFSQQGIAVRWMNYDGYPAYSQPYPPFDHHVSVIDLLLQVGPSAMDYIRRPGEPNGPEATTTDRVERALMADSCRT